MKFVVTKASDDHYERLIEINMIEELLDFVRQNGRVILTQRPQLVFVIPPNINEPCHHRPRTFPDVDFGLLIYDDYLE